MKKIEAIETRDGKIFKDLSEAQIHNAELELKEQVNILVTRECYSGMGSTDVYDFILENTAEITKIADKIKILNALKK